MHIGHFDVDENIQLYLNDKVHSESIHDMNISFPYECITVKSASIVDSKSLSHFPECKLVVTRTVGTDHIDINYCKDQKIAVYHVVDYGSYNIAEHAIALLLSGMHNILFCQDEIKNGIFSYKNWQGTSFVDKKVGVLGTGRIGLEFIKRIKVFTDTISAFDIYKNEKAALDFGFRYVDFPELIETSDIISIHAPLTSETIHIIDAEVIRQMKQGVILINTSRGGLINTNDLVENINKFKFIGLDVLEDEKQFSKNHPLLKCNNVIITPHIAFFTDDSVKKIASETYTCIENYKRNDPNGRVV